MNFNPKLFLQILQNFSIDFVNFGIKDDQLYDQILYLLNERGAYFKNHELAICPYNKILVAILAVENGVDILNVCKHIDWHDFELFTSEIMRYNEYVVYNNFRMKKPTREIDVVGIKSENALLIDCKHWKSGSISSLKPVVEKQKFRCIQFMNQSYHSIKNFFPIIITFIPAEITFIDNVPIVPISSLNSFLVDFDENTQYLFRI